MNAVSSWPHSTKPIRANPPAGTVGIVLPIRDNLKFFKLAFHSILDFTDHRFMLTLVDNMSDFSTRQYLESIRRNHQVNILQYQQTHAQGAEWNLGLRFMFAFANVQYGVTLTPDVVVEPSWLSRLVRAMDSGASNDIVLPQSNEKSDDVPSFCMAMKREAYEKVGGFDNGYHDARYAASDFAQRARMSALRMFWETQVYVHHFKRSGASLDPESIAEDTAKFNNGKVAA